MIVLRHPYDRKRPRVELARAYDVVVSRIGGSKSPWEHIGCETPEGAARQLAIRAEALAGPGYQKAGEDEPLEPRHSQLEEAIAQSPDDAAAYLAYADWLQARGDPRGELIVVHHALSITGLDEEDARVLPSPHRSGEKLRVMDLRRLRAAHGRLLRQHCDRFLGPSLQGQRYLAGGSWFLGFLRRINLEVRDTPALNGKLDAVLRHPSARFVQELGVDVTIVRDWGLLQTVLDDFVRQNPRPALREVEVRSHSAAPLAQVAAFCEAYPLLKSLDIPSPIELASLRHSGIETLGLHPSSLPTGRQPFKRDALPRLRHLQIHDPQSAAPLDELLNGAAPANLRVLTFAPVRLTVELASALAKSQLLRQLEELHLRGSFSEEGIAEMLRWRNSFRHLRRLSATPAIDRAMPHVKTLKQLGSMVEIAPG